MTNSICYFAKEPGTGVRSDLDKIKKKYDDIMVIDCLNAYGDWYRKKGYNCIDSKLFLKLGKDDIHFDYAVGNPPFQENGHKAKTSSLWKKFLDKSWELSDNVSLIVPASFSSPTKLFGKYKNNLSSIDFTIDKKFKGVGSTFSVISLTKEDQVKCKVKTHNGTYIIDINEWDCIPKDLDDDIMSLIDKYFISQDYIWKVGYEYDQRKDCIVDDGKINILHSTKTLKTNKDHPNNHLIRVFCTITNGTKFEVCYPGTGLSQNNIWSKCNTLEDAVKLKDYLNQSDIQRLLKSFQFSNMNYYQIINKLNMN